MKDQVFTDIKNTIDVISLHQARQRKFQKELEFFQQRWPEVSTETKTMGPELYISALRRLGHEVMFLTIETFSLHNGIVKDKSLISKSIKQKSSLICKIDKSDSVSEENYTHCGIYTDEGKREATQDEINKSIKDSNKWRVKARKKLRDKSGIKSKNHADIDVWVERLVNQDGINKLEDLRHDFAHSLDDLEKIQNGTYFYNAKYIGDILNLIKDILETYKKRLNEVLTYTCSQDYQGIVSTYDSLPRLEFYHTYKDKLNKI